MKTIKHPRTYLTEQRDAMADLLEEAYIELNSLLEETIQAHGRGCVTPDMPEAMELQTLLTKIEEAKTQAFMDKHAHPTKGQPVYVWSRDCDNCESDSVSWIHPEYGEFQEFCDNVEAGAEGRYRIQLLTQAEAEEFEPTFRDRAMEAYENGRGANAYCV